MSLFERTSEDLNSSRVVLHHFNDSFQAIRSHICSIISLSGQWSNSFQAIQSHICSIISLSEQWSKFHNSFVSIQSSLANNVKELEVKEREIESLQNKLSNQQEQAKLVRVSLEDCRKEVELRQKAVERRENDVNAWVEELRLEKKRVREWRKAVEAKAKRVEEREKEVEEKGRGEGFEERGRVVEEREKAVEVREEEIDRRMRELEAKEEGIDERCRLVGLEEKRIQEHCERVGLKEREAEERCEAQKLRDKEEGAIVQKDGLKDNISIDMEMDVEDDSNELQNKEENISLLQASPAAADRDRSEQCGGNKRTSNPCNSLELPQVKRPRAGDPESPVSPNVPTPSPIICPAGNNVELNTATEDTIVEKDKSEENASQSELGGNKQSSSPCTSLVSPQQEKRLRPKTLQSPLPSNIPIARPVTTHSVPVNPPQPSPQQHQANGFVMWPPAVNGSNAYIGVPGGFYGSINALTGQFNPAGVFLYVHPLRPGHIAGGQVPYRPQ